jgi:hypothetical protein
MQFSKLVNPEPFLRAQHLNNKNFITWALIHVTPSIYNFSNTVWLEKNPSHDDIFKKIIDGDINSSNQQLNHYPLRKATFGNERVFCFRKYYPMIYLQSSYRGQAFITAYEIKTLQTGCRELVKTAELHHEY